MKNICCGCCQVEHKIQPLALDVHQVVKVRQAMIGQACQEFMT